ncbi:putative transmembrane protein 242 [Lasius niger]|uniref:Transmembrane protein 242 n=1 Tax=Lasius niger TaxID=67767 RepID=A0A0J7KLI5_LASNI|nr:putative transmembrane protein 242 [Lasius niger]
MAESEDTAKTSLVKSAKQKEKIYAAVFLSAVTSISALAGFARAVGVARKQDPKYFGEGLSGVKGVNETGASLAIRALGWGSLCAITGCGLFFYGIWKISGATNAEEFRFKMGSLLPKIPKNNPPQSRTEFEGLTDLLMYISEDWGRNKEVKFV